MLHDKVPKTFHWEMQVKLLHQMSPKSTNQFLAILFDQWCKAWKYRNTNCPHMECNHQEIKIFKERFHNQNWKRLQMQYVNNFYVKHNS